MRLVDENGNDVIITGVDAINTVEAINETASGDFKVYIDQKTGKLSYSGNSETPYEYLLELAINDKNIEVNLITLKGICYNNEVFAVGGYFGSETKNYIENTYQTFNLEAAKKYEEAGGSNPGLSALHEIIESYLGGKFYPNQGTKYKVIKKNYEIIHNFLIKYLEKEQKHPKIIYTFNRNTGMYNGFIMHLDELPPVEFKSNAGCELE